MKPEPQWMKLNVDGARMSLSGRTGAGGGWDHNGDWKLGFTACLGCGEVLHADAKISGKILVESDSEVLVHLMENDVDDLHPLKGLLNNCRFLQSQFQEIEIHHI